MVAAPRRRLAPRSRHSTAVSRPPVIIDFGDTVVRIGIAGDASAKQIIPSSPATAQATHHTTSAQYYRSLAPLVEQIFESILQKPSERKVIVVVALYASRSWKEALLQCLFDLSVPAVAVVSHVECVPMMFPALQDILVVYVSLQDACTAVHAQGHMLPFTFHSVALSRTETNHTAAALDEHVLYNPVNPQSVIFSILKTLEACPIAVRKQVVHNMVVVGDGVVTRPDVPRSLAQHLRALLQNPTRHSRFEPSASEKNEQYPETPPLLFSPVDLSSLAPLATSVGLLSTAPYRPDMCAWVGASVWASLWYDAMDQDQRFVWHTPPSDPEKSTTVDQPWASS